MNPRRSNISKNAGRLVVGSWKLEFPDNAPEFGKYCLSPQEAVILATEIEDAVDAAENARQDALHKANETKRAGIKTLDEKPVFETREIGKCITYFQKFADGEVYYRLSTTTSQWYPAKDQPTRAFSAKQLRALADALDS